MSAARARSAPPPALIRALWAVVALLVALGVFAAVGRPSFLTISSRAPNRSGAGTWRRSVETIPGRCSGPPRWREWTARSPRTTR